MPNEVDHITKDWWRRTSLQEYLKALFLFCLLATALLWQLHCFGNFILFIFLSRKTLPLLKQQLPELEGFRDSWLDVMTHSETQTLFCTGTRSSSVGVAEAGTLKLDLRALKYQNPFFFLRVPFYTLNISNVNLFPLFQWQDCKVANFCFYSQVHDQYR